MAHSLWHILFLRFPVGDVQRGCSDIFYNSDDGKPWPTSGCVSDGDGEPFVNNYLCFCTGDNCNVEDLSDQRKDMIQYHNSNPQ